MDAEAIDVTTAALKHALIALRSAIDSRSLADHLVYPAPDDFYER